MTAGKERVRANLEVARAALSTALSATDDQTPEHVRRRVLTAERKVRRALSDLDEAEVLAVGELLDREFGADAEAMGK